MKAAFLLASLLAALPAMGLTFPANKWYYQWTQNGELFIGGMAAQVKENEGVFQKGTSYAVCFRLTKKANWHHTFVIGFPEQWADGPGLDGRPCPRCARLELDAGDVRCAQFDASSSVWKGGVAKFYLEFRDVTPFANPQKQVVGKVCDKSNCDVFLKTYCNGGKAGSCHVGDSA